MGLSTALSILKSHGGFVDVNSQLGKGTDIAVYFPVAAEPEEQTHIVEIGEVPGGHGELVLIGDDEESIRQNTKTTLETLPPPNLSACFLFTKKIPANFQNHFSTSQRAKACRESKHMETEDRVRDSTSEEVNYQLDRALEARVRSYEQRSSAEITQRIEELDREWDMERFLETNASAIAFTGLALGVTHNKKWLVIPGIVLPFLFQHAVQGWCPPIPLFRRLGVRTRKEIDKEKYALKVLRGDFDKSELLPSAENALVAVNS